MELKGKTAIVTGSTSGIGHGIAWALASVGVNLIINGFGKKEDIEEKRKEIESRGVQCIYHDADLSQPQQIESLIGEAQKKFGGVDILVNNAGIQYVSPVEDFPPEKWDLIIAVNLTASFHTIRKALPLMKKAGWGRIINIASTHALIASPFKSAYVAAKHGLAGLTKTVALETAKQNITVNAICPGYVKTPLVEGQIVDTARVRGITEEEVVKNIMLDAQPTGKFIGVEQIGELVIFLCSDGAQNITGACLPIDGGWTAS